MTFVFQIIQESGEFSTQGSDEFLRTIPVQQFKWLVILSALALHGVVTAIVTELMGRSYGKWFMWALITFSLPVIGPISLLLYHNIASRGVLSARRRSFWNRFLYSGPVSLLKSLQKEKREAEQVKLRDFKIRTENIRSNGSDKTIDSLLKDEDFAGARAHAWKMLEIARETRDKKGQGKYMAYLDLIAEKEAVGAGITIE